MLALKLVSEPAQEMLPYTPKVILFEDLTPRRFFIKEQKAEEGKQFMLSVQSHVPVKIGLSINEAKPKNYGVKGNKAILIPTKEWN